MSEIREALKRFVQGEQPEWLLLAKVTGVDTLTQTCTCLDNAGNEYLDVRIQPLVGSATAAGFYLLPKRNSWVVIGSLQGKDEHAVLMVSELDRVEMKTGITHMILKNEGLVVKNAAENLATLMADFLDAQSDLIDQIKLLTVTCSAPGSPSSPPINLAAFTTLDTALTTLKTRFNSLLKSS